MPKNEMERRIRRLEEKLLERSRRRRHRKRSRSERRSRSRSTSGERSSRSPRRHRSRNRKHKKSKKHRKSTPSTSSQPHTPPPPPPPPTPPPPKSTRFLSPTTSAASVLTSMPAPQSDEEDYTTELHTITGEDASTSLHANISGTEQDDEELEEDLLQILGEVPQEKTQSAPIHKDVASRWNVILKKGLPKDTKKELLERYPAPINCPTLGAPKLNAEVKAAMAEAITKRDKVLEYKQTQIGCALTALGLGISEILKKCPENEELIKNISDAARLLCDEHHSESITRRKFILSGLSKQSRDALQETDIDSWLFSESLADKLKASKAIKQSSSELRTPAKNYRPTGLNQRGPPAKPIRQQRGRQQSNPGGPRRPLLPRNQMSMPNRPMTQSRRGNYQTYRTPRNLQ